MIAQGRAINEEKKYSNCHLQNLRTKKGKFILNRVIDNNKKTTLT
jgi:hypothetical protein